MWPFNAKKTPPKPSAPEAAPVRIVAMDGWVNETAGYGTARDKVAAGYFTAGALLDDWTLQSLWQTNALAARVIEKLPDECFRKGYKLKSDDEEQAKALRDAGELLSLDDKLLEADHFARAYGTGFLFLGVRDGLSLSAPLVPERVRAIDFINVLDRRFVEVAGKNLDPSAPNFGEPDYYRIQGSASGNLIHASRFIRLDGIKADTKRPLYGGSGWGLPVLQRVYDELRAFGTAHSGVASLLSDASQAVFTIQGLMQMIASGEKSTLETRMGLVDRQRSSGRAILLDADGEKFERIATSFAGIPETIDRVMLLLSAVTGMPATVLFGRDPAGMNATGEGDLSSWYGEVGAYQEKKFGPALRRVYGILSRGTLEGVEIEWCPLWVPSAKEEAETDKLRADRDVAYINAGVLFAEEVALARFGESSNGEIEIDEEARKASLAAELEAAKDPAPPPPPPGASPLNPDGAPNGTTSSTGEEESPREAPRSPEEG